MRLLNSLKTLFTPKLQPSDITVVQTATGIDLQLRGQSVPIGVTINNDTITISTPLNIVIKAGMYAVKADNGIHLNPRSLNVQELEQRYLEQQSVIEHSTQECIACTAVKPTRKSFKQKLLEKEKKVR